MESRYGGGRGQKWPKIGDIIYEWPRRSCSDEHSDISG